MLLERQNEWMNDLSLYSRYESRDRETLTDRQTDRLDTRQKPSLSSLKQNRIFCAYVQIACLAGTAFWHLVSRGVGLRLGRRSNSLMINFAETVMMPSRALETAILDSQSLAMWFRFKQIKQRPCFFKMCRLAACNPLTCASIVSYVCRSFLTSAKEAIRVSFNRPSMWLLIITSLFPNLCSSSSTAAS